ncbi:hypothetical protein FISHEDRAFT_61066 [Fistulina hepatica ATCC 64428]|uniref:Fungal-type protein kinase domain-containing protein n=1 Tax=Fistulina hepatica ATCC 64428 TaxID=1128425 RepID=A0A0D7A5K7_9AGAR|nr:hypothetical protein FISHEDRAFT_61066 [Fistulina hepatica ATCC 64428]
MSDNLFLSDARANNSLSPSTRAASETTLADPSTPHASPPPKPATLRASFPQPPTTPKRTASRQSANINHNKTPTHRGTRDPDISQEPEEKAIARKFHVHEMSASIRGPLDPDVFTRFFVGDEDYYAGDSEIERRRKVHDLLRDISQGKSTIGAEKRQEKDIYPPIVLAYRELMPELYSRSMSSKLAMDCGPGRRYPDVATSAREPPRDLNEPILFSEIDLLTEAKLDRGDPFHDPLPDDEIQHDPFTSEFAEWLGESASLPVESSREASDANVEQDDYESEGRDDSEEQDDGATIGGDSLDADDAGTDQIDASCLRAESCSERLYHSNPNHLADIERIHAKLSDYNPLRPKEAANSKVASHVESVPTGDLLEGAKNDPPMLAPSLQEEVAILKVLEEKGVEHVPRYQYGGYVPVYDGARPVSRNQELFVGLSTFEQYRFVCTPLCRPLECADDVLQFARAIQDAFIAHMEAWEHPTNDASKQVLHRDVSDTNIQIGPDADAEFIKGCWRLTGGREKEHQINKPKGWLATLEISRFPAFGQWCWYQLKQKLEALGEDEQDRELEDPSGLGTHQKMKKLFEELVQSLEEPGMNAKFPPLPDQFAAQRKSERDRSKNIGVRRAKQSALEREQQKLAIQQEAQQHSSRAGSSQASTRHSASVSSSKRSSGQKRESGTLGEIEHSASKRRRSSAVTKGMDL